MPKREASATATWDTAIELSCVSKTFYQQQHRATGALKSLLRTEKKAVHALSDVSYRIDTGEFVALAGPNGAGKSTTFKLLCGMLKPEAGQVRTLGMDPMRRRIDIMRHCGVLFGNRSELWWDHPVIASFEWKKEVWGIDETAYRQRLGLVTELLELSPLLHTFARELSLGQRMRADLAMMLLHSPRLILLDEPTLGLDVLAKRQMIGFLKHLNHHEGVTILVTSHDMDDLTQMARRLVLIHEGRIAFDGTAAQLSQEAGRKRTLALTSEGPAPELSGAQFVSTERGRHLYTFDQQSLPVQALMRELSTLPGITDIETGDAPIEEVIADLYLRWKA